MALYYKKVDAIQFKLTDEEKELIKNRKPVTFEGAQVKHIGGTQYLALLQQGENLLRIYETQWLVKHPDGMLQILWPDRFGANFIQGRDVDLVSIQHDPLLTKSYNQPNTIL
jgi:hypothetical protein